MSNLTLASKSFSDAVKGILGENSDQTVANRTRGAVRKNLNARDHKMESPDREHYHVFNGKEYENWKWAFTCDLEEECEHFYESRFNAKLVFECKPNIILFPCIVEISTYFLDLSTVLPTLQRPLRRPACTTLHLSDRLPYPLCEPSSPS